VTVVLALYISSISRSMPSQQ